MNYEDHTELLEQIATQQELNALQAASTALQMAEHILERQSFATLKRLEAMFPLPPKSTEDELAEKQATEHYNDYTEGKGTGEERAKRTTAPKKRSTKKK